MLRSSLNGSAVATSTPCQGLRDSVIVGPFGGARAAPSLCCRELPHSLIYHVTLHRWSKWVPGRNPAPGFADLRQLEGAGRASLRELRTAFRQPSRVLRTGRR